MDIPRNAPYVKRYYRDIEGALYHSICLGYHIETGEQYAALRRLADGTVWIVPAVEFHKVLLINGVPTHVYTREYSVSPEELYPNRNSVVASEDTSDAYPGYTDDPRPIRRN